MAACTFLFHFYISTCERPGLGPTLSYLHPFLSYSSSLAVSSARLAPPYSSTMRRARYLTRGRGRRSGSRAGLLAIVSECRRTESDASGLVPMNAPRGRSQHTPAARNLYSHPHLIARLKSQRLIQRASIRARMQDHEVNLILAAPGQRRLHQRARQATTAERPFRINIQDVAASRSRAQNMRRPIHQPQSRPSRNLALTRNRQPRQVFPRLHLPPQPRPKPRRHRVERSLIRTPHITKHRPPMSDNRLHIVKCSGADREAWRQSRHTCNCHTLDFARVILKCDS